jgi:hypothetical protein
MKILSVVECIFLNPACDFETKVIPFWSIGQVGADIYTLYTAPFVRLAVLVRYLLAL